MSYDQYKFVDGHFVDTWNIEKYPDAIDTNLNWFADLSMGSSWAEAWLNLCGCGNPEDVVDAMLDYLTRVEAGWTEPRVFQIRDDHHLADLLLAYLADNRHLTEHGGGIYGVWLTAEGVRWLELARSAAPDPSPDGS